MTVGSRVDSSMRTVRVPSPLSVWVVPAMMPAEETAIFASQVASTFISR